MVRWSGTMFPSASATAGSKVIKGAQHFRRTPNPSTLVQIRWHKDFCSRKPLNSRQDVAQFDVQCIRSGAGTNDRLTHKQVGNTMHQRI